MGVFSLWLFQTGTLEYRRILPTTFLTIKKTRFKCCSSRTPVSVDESLVTLQDAARIARDGIAEIFGIKLNRVGGLTKAARMRDVALAHGIDMFVMATGGSVLADCEALQLAATIPDHACHAVWACQDMLTVDIAAGRGPRNQNGHLHLPEAPGLGVHPDEDVLGDPVAVYR